jgi:hypothetical protein
MCPAMVSSTQDKEFGSLLITDSTTATNGLTSRRLLSMAGCWRPGVASWQAQAAPGYRSLLYIWPLFTHIFCLSRIIQPPLGYASSEHETR